MFMVDVICKGCFYIVMRFSWLIVDGDYYKVEVFKMVIFQCRVDIVFVIFIGIKLFIQGGQGVLESFVQLVEYFLFGFNDRFFFIEVFFCVGVLGELIVMVFV